MRVKIVAMVPGHIVARVSLWNGDIRGNLLGLGAIAKDPYYTPTVVSRVYVMWYGRSNKRDSRVVSRRFYASCSYLPIPADQVPTLCPAG